MTDLNSVTIIGRLTKDGELSYTKGGTPILKMAIAVNKSMKQQDGTYKDAASFFDLAVWGKYGEAMAKHCTKGKQLGIQGELEQQRWTDQSGANKSKVVINVRNMELLADPRGAQGSQPTKADGYDHIPDEKAEDGGTERFEDDVPW